jgi:hypothetical protein
MLWGQWDPLGMGTDHTATLTRSVSCISSTRYRAVRAILSAASLLWQNGLNKGRTLHLSLLWLLLVRASVLPVPVPVTIP